MLFQVRALVTTMGRSGREKYRSNSASECAKYSRRPR
jgi:hypothetical protein